MINELELLLQYSNTTIKLSILNFNFLSNLKKIEINKIVFNFI